MNNISKITNPNHMTKHQNAIAEKKQNVWWKGTAKLMM